MASHLLDHFQMIAEHGRSFSLLLCHYALFFLVFVVVFFFSSPSSFIIVLGKSQFFLLVLRKTDGLNWSCEIISRLFIVARN